MFTIYTGLPYIVIIESVVAIVAQREPETPVPAAAPGYARRGKPPTLENKISGLEQFIASQYSFYLRGGNGAESARKELEWNVPRLLAMYKERATKQLVEQHKAA
jgi:hypothetical protein